ncbi:MAG: UDP-N-acetylglucosamine 2-epimerase (hydrolyzing) [Bacteroidetes bacterium HGW-Bacteroidetes-8]|jgi:GDP/UDP-N,N'-diacetylbacillosamine 2-epimerase (hydrolysing)|nr:MAG: UDP-N-acetylglucosamine 2-epimerase (hydrolyzing) [Bacteroidetes bacterium HGW-Bacteroidetes-8]
MKIGVLTSSRADFGIYLPLLKALKNDPFFQFELIVFGTHLSKFNGYTVKHIVDEGFEPTYQIHQMLLTDDPNSIATSYALTSLKFAEFWKDNRFDCVFCIGDRYEMAAAVIAGIPYNVLFAHIHGGETTLGAIDNIYRHSITLASKWHFVATKTYKERVKEITGNSDNCLIIGSLSLFNLKQMKLLNLAEFYNKWQIDLSIPSILITLHPETVAFNHNEKYVSEALTAFKVLCKNYQLIVTMPNSDTLGTVYRFAFNSLKEYNFEKVFLIENFGTQSYFSCMKYVGLIIGNSSSGIIEAASFRKYVINIGDRQKGRLISDNTKHVAFDSELIFQEVNKLFGKDYTGTNIYLQNQPVQRIIKFLKKQH